MQPEPAEVQRSEAEFLEYARGNLRRNYTAHLLHGLFGQTGFRLLNAPTFIPVYIFMLSGSEIFVGLARAAQALGQCLTPMFSATLIEHRARVLPIGLIVGSVMRLQVLGIALAGFFLPPELALGAIVLLLALFGVFLGMQGVIFGFLMSKVIPVEVRGSLQGLRNFLAGLTSAAIAGLGGWFIDHEFLGNGYASTFLVAFFFTALGLSMLLIMREPPSPDVRERSSVVGRLGDLPSLLRSDSDFTAYFILRAIATLGRIAVPYYIIYAGTLFPVKGGEIALFTAAWTLSMTTSNLVWGLMADRTGFRLVFLLAMGVWAASVLGLMLTTGLLGVTLVFVGVGAGMGGFQISQQNLVLEFGSRQNLPLRIGVANTASELTAAIGLALGGLVVLEFGYFMIFWIAIGFKLLALGLTPFLVREPRFR